jgi:Fe-S-cluster containining protein/plasmid stabilization system protein ParE
VAPPATDDPLPAGRFGTWLAEVRSAIDGDGTSAVPCGGCTACCRASQFVHIGPEEVDTLARIPPALLFPAPGAPPGHVLLGYDEHGRCPLLTTDGCSIYADRPRTCRTYDCRIFAATGVSLEGEGDDDDDDDDDKAGIAARVRRWRFEPLTGAEEVQRDALRAAARALGDHPGAVPGRSAPLPATERAVLAVGISDVFVAEDGTGEVRVVEPDAEAVRVAVTRRRGSGRST